MVELYWSEHERGSNIAWNGYIDLPVVCLHWVALTSDKDERKFMLSLSRSLQYNSALGWKNKNYLGILFELKDLPQERTANSFGTIFHVCICPIGNWSVASLNEGAEMDFAKAVMKQLVGSADFGYFMYVKDTGNTVPRYKYWN